MKNKKIPLILAASVLAITGLVACNNSGGNTPTPTPEPEVSYSITVNYAATSELVYTCPTSAKQGEKVTLTITSLATGYSVSAVKVNGTQILETAQGSGKYEFLMPGADVTIQVDTSYNPTPVVDYKIMVTVPTGVEYNIDYERATPGTVVTFVVTKLPEGATIKDVMMNTTKLTAELDGKTYKFTMPNNSVSITMTLDMAGDVVISGEFSTVLTEDPQTGIYAAKNVLVTNGSSAFAKINAYAFGNKLGALDLNELDSFGSIQLCGDKEYELKIAANTYYDFYYNPAKVTSGESPLTIKRVGVADSALPKDQNTLETMLIASPSVRSNYSIYTGDLLSVSYDKVQTSKESIYGTSSTDDYMNQKYTWNRYKNNTTFAKVEAYDMTAELEDTMYVYKNYNEADGVYKVVDTFSKYSGNILANDDYFRNSYNNNEYYAATYGVRVDAEEAGSRFNITPTQAVANINTSAHMPAGFVQGGGYLEGDIMYAYRVGFEADEVSSYNKTISTVRNADDGFVTTLNSYIEYDSTAGTYTIEIHKAFVYEATITFDKRGAVTDLSFKKTEYTQDKWDFSTHTPSGKGSVTKKITAKYTYGTPSETFSSSEFNPSDYFVNKITAVQFYNSATEKDPADGKSYVSIGDKLAVASANSGAVPSGSTEHPEVLQYDYEPKTAIDTWQYAPTKSSDDKVVAKKATDLYYYMSATGVGDATVTISNHLEGKAGGATFDFEVNVTATTLIKDIYLIGDAGPYDYITNATPVTVKAGSSHTYTVVPTPTGKAPIIYHAESSDTSLCKVVSDDNDEYLKLDFSPAIGITDTKTITIHLTSDAYDPTWGSLKKDGKTFTFYITPTDIDPLGTWKASDTKAYPNSEMTFTNEKYEGSVASGYEGAKKGYVADEYVSSGKSAGVDYYYFYYVYANFEVKAVVYDYNLTYTIAELEEATGDSFVEFEIAFTYEATSGRYGLFLAPVMYSSYYEDYYYVNDDGYCIFGGIDSSGEIYSFTPFDFKSKN